MSLSDKLDKIIENQEKIISLLNRHEENHIILDKNQLYTENPIGPYFWVNPYSRDFDELHSKCGTGTGWAGTGCTDFESVLACLSAKSGESCTKSWEEIHGISHIPSDELKNSWQNYL